VLNALDYLVPGEWVDITDFDEMITHTTGVTDPKEIKRIRKRALSLYKDPDTNYSKALLELQYLHEIGRTNAPAQAVLENLGATVGLVLASPL